jgi:hypothetical protein
MIGPLCNQLSLSSLYIIIHTWLFGGVCVAHLLVFCVVLLCVLTFWVPCCDVRYYLCINMMFGLSLPPVFIGGRVICIWWCPTYIVLCFLLCFSSSLFANMIIVFKCQIAWYILKVCTTYLITPVVNLYDTTK